jgi:5'(3')-deoxyribonucleotidase
MKRKRVLLDVDGVLADLLTPCLAVASELVGRELTAADLPDWHFESLLPAPGMIKELWRRIGAYGVCRFLKPHPGAVEGVRALSEVADVYAVTAPLSANPQWTSEREAWLLQHFAIPRNRVVHTSAKYVVSGAMLVDDKPAHVGEWAREHERGIPVLWEHPHTASHKFGYAVEHRVVRTRDWSALRTLVEDV